MVVSGDFLPIPGEMIQFHSYFSNGLKPPTRIFVSRERIQFSKKIKKTYHFFCLGKRGADTVFSCWTTSAFLPFSFQRRWSLRCHGKEVQGREKMELFNRDPCNALFPERDAIYKFLFQLDDSKSLQKMAISPNIH